MKIKRVLLDILSSFCVNLSSGFAGVAIIIPIFSQAPIELNVVALIFDLIMATLLLVLALVLKLWKI